MSGILLKIVKGSWNFEKDFVIIKRGLTIGRSTDNKMILNDSTVSDHHCLIFKLPSGWFVKDMKSKNGTVIIMPNGEKTMATNKISILLESKCQIILGETIIKII